ncbi:MAG TPA: site-specific DNA-methyltransferase [Ktedonobacteraceae bacterium]|nr:site-specific DNA-methyltransferase [Ktedonobacteraceae bacterium]
MEPTSDLTRILYCGDNLPLLRAHLPDECVDLLYLDPPFYSQRNYQAFFKAAPASHNGHARAAAFGDIWRWDAEGEQTYAEMLANAPAAMTRTLASLRDLLGPGSLLAYLGMMATRLFELRRVLKPTGSLYLHCDQAASHYLKLLLDSIFGPTNFRNEIVWCYKTGGASHRHFSKKHDLLFFYTKSDQYTFHALKEKSYMMHRYGFKKSEFLRDERGEYTWVYMKDVWDIPALGAADGQRLGYPTQKPEALLERIIRASSDEGGIVLDPFCGSGTTLATAQRLGRGWIGIESNYLGIAYQRYRLAQAFPDLRYTCAGGPATLTEALQLARVDATQYRWWVLALLCARPVGEEDRAYNAGIAHGILPASPGELAPSLVLVALEQLEMATVQYVCELIEKGNAGRVLIITLETPSVQAIRAAFTRVLKRASAFSSSIEIRTVADLLASPLSSLKKHI